MWLFEDAEAQIKSEAWDRMFCAIFLIVGTPFDITPEYPFFPPNENTIVIIFIVKSTQAQWEIWVIQKSTQILDKD